MNIKNKIFQAFSKGEKISAQDSFKMVSDGKAILVDVREQEEVDDGMASPAQWLPTSEIESQSEVYHKFLKSLSKDKPVIIYCAAGVRAGRFAITLQGMGFKTYNMGGFDSWESAGLPTKTP